MNCWLTGIIYKIFQGEVKVEKQSVIVKEDADEKDRLTFDLDRGLYNLASWGNSNSWERIHATLANIFPKTNCTSFL